MSNRTKSAEDRKSVMVWTRVTPELGATLHSLAAKNQIELAAMVRVLLLKALAMPQGSESGDLVTR